ncbi:hypothetical protein EG68_06747 [Paragonimus skrjabini miyazakii]|uniref:Uncharacterized protein n=1 Tax=Paragonimus skrjabini miyazakii TaxID=59628 RepID=A0A8S9YY54_9TREM|nr:hypothetical protein EG68_06747 [Paragonimus skrjabini miyazakii]
MFIRERFLLWTLTLQVIAQPISLLADVSSPSIQTAGLTNSFCKANKKCAELSSLATFFLIGRHVGRMNTKLSSNVSVWTSMHKVVPFSNSTKASWYDADPRTTEAITPPPMLNVLSEPESYGPVALVTNPLDNLKTSSVSIQQSAEAICEVMNTKTLLIQLIHFHMCWPNQQPLGSLSDIFQPDCYRVIKRSTKLACFFMCAINIYCRSVYFKRKKTRCVLIFFVFAYLPTKYSYTKKRWMCYRKTNGISDIIG